MKPYHSFETERLLLRPTSEEDAQFIFELMNSPAWIKHIGDRNISSVNRAKVYIRSKISPQLERLGYSSYTVIRKSDRIKIGTCGLYDREGLEGIDIGFAFFPEYGGQGYAFEAASRIGQAGFEQFGLSRILAITKVDNLASQRLLGKLGLNLKGKITLPGDDEELFLYDLMKDEGIQAGCKAVIT